LSRYRRDRELILQRERAGGVGEEKSLRPAELRDVQVSGGGVGRTRAAVDRKACVRVPLIRQNDVIEGGENVVLPARWIGKRVVDKDLTILRCTEDRRVSELI
jgi:hypothetical protein